MGQAEHPMLTKRLVRILIVAAALGIIADVARASIFPGPFSFTFFTPALNSLFLLPFQIAGCGS